MKLKHLVTAFLLIAASLTTAHAQEEFIEIPQSEQRAFWDRFGQHIAIVSVPRQNDILTDGFILTIPQAKVRLGGAVINVRNVVLGVPLSSLAKGVKLKDPNVALDGGVVFFFDEALLHLPGFYYSWAGKGKIFLRTSLSTQNVKFLSFEIVP